MSTLMVLGASSDIGTALIDLVASDYDIIWAQYRTYNDKLAALKSRYGERIRLLQANLRSKDDINGMITAVSDDGNEPDHIVHIPMAKYQITKFVKTDEEYFEEAMELAIRSSVMPLQAFLPGMKKRKHGRVVFVLSSVTTGDAPSFQSAYVTVKYALLGLMKSLASEYSGSGICINAVSPDMIKTGYLDDVSHLIVEQHAASMPDGKLLEVEDVIPQIKKLLTCGDDLTGENVYIG